MGLRCVTHIEGCHIIDWRSVLFIGWVMTFKRVSLGKEIISGSHDGLELVGGHVMGRGL